MTEEAWRLGIYDQERIEDRSVDEFIGICRGVIYDGTLSDEEIVRLEEWCRFNRAAFAQWPLDVIATRLVQAVEDGEIKDSERADLLSLLATFVGSDRSDDLAAPTALPLSDPAPDVLYPNRLFCFTGTFAYGTRKTCEAAVTERGGKCAKSFNGSVSYLVIGSRVTPAWIHANFGRKIEAAAELAQAGAPIRIISEAHWTRSLNLVGKYDPLAVERSLQEALATGSDVRFLYRGARRVIRPHRFTTSYNQPAVEGTYLGGDSPDPERPIRQYLLHHIAEVQVVTS